jgi:hypothetical protein
MGVAADTILAMPPPPPPEPPLQGRQLHVPIFPASSRMLGERVAVVERDGVVWYFHYDMPVFSHAVSDQASFRMFTSSLCDKGQCKLVEVERAFAVTAISVKRALKQYRAHGPQSFFTSRRQTVVPRVLKGETLAAVQALLDEGVAPRAIEDRLGVKADTIRNAIEDGRLHRPKKGGPATSR